MQIRFCATNYMSGVGCHGNFFYERERDGARERANTIVLYTHFRIEGRDNYANVGSLSV